MTKYARAGIDINRPSFKCGISIPYPPFSSASSAPSAVRVAFCEASATRSCRRNPAMRPISRRQALNSCSSECARRCSSWAMICVRVSPRTATMNGGVHLLQPCKFFRRAAIQAGAGLLAARCTGQPPRQREPAREFGMRANQSQLLFVAGCRDNLFHCRMQHVARTKRPRLPCPLRNPGRMLVDAAELRDERLAVHRIDLTNRNRHAGARWGCCRAQWRAISTRRQTQTLSRASAAMRAGRPASRQCRPIDSIFGADSPSA